MNKMVIRIWRSNPVFFKTIPITIIILSILLGGFLRIAYICTHPTNLNHYGEGNYTFAHVIIGSGKSETSYYGAIENKEYDKWINGESGTLWLETSNKKQKGYGYRINITSITSIVLYDDNYVVLNFYMSN